MVWLLHADQRFPLYTCCATTQWYNTCCAANKTLLVPVVAVQPA
jgi:hypothetical protein